MILKFSKKFSYKECLKYRDISKDNNIIHFKNNNLKKTYFEKPIVFGTLIIETVLEKINYTKYDFDLDAIFKRPVFIGEEINFYIKKKKNIYEIKFFNFFENKGSINIIINNFKTKNFNNLITKELRNLTKSVGNYRKQINLILKIKLQRFKYKKQKKFYPINNKIIEYQHYSNKIYSKVTFLSSKNKIKFKNIDMKKIQIGSLKNLKNILVIGSNSSLGKILINFFNKKKIKFHGSFYKTNPFPGNKNFFKLNINSIKTKDLNKISNYNLIFYFPSPIIFTENSNFFNNKKFLEFIKIYINSLDKIINFLGINNGKKYKLFIPSSSVLNNNQSNPEYGISKLAQESYIKLVNRNIKNIKIINPRLDAISSETTKSLAITNSNYENVISSILEKL